MPFEPRLCRPAVSGGHSGPGLCDPVNDRDPVIRLYTRPESVAVPCGLLVGSTNMQPVVEHCRDVESVLIQRPNRSFEFEARQDGNSPPSDTHHPLCRNICRVTRFGETHGGNAQATTAATTALVLHPDNSSRHFARQPPKSPLPPILSMPAAMQYNGLRFASLATIALPFLHLIKDQSMAATPAISAETLDRLAKYDTPTVCNAIELWDIRPRNTGFMDGSIQACFPKMPPMSASP